MKYIIVIINNLLEVALKIAQVVFTGLLVRYFQNPERDMREGFMYAGLLALSCYMHATVHHHIFWPSVRSGMRIRSGLTGLIYRKSLSLPAADSLSTGEIVNMLSNDVQTFEYAAPFVAYVFTVPIEIAAVTYFLVREIGWATFAGFAAFAVLFPIQAFFGKYFAVYRDKVVKYRDERVSTVADICSEFS